MRRLLIAVALLSLAPLASAAQVYKWKDASGTVHYSQTPPDQGTYKRIKTSDSSQPLAAAAPTAPANAATAPAAAAPAAAPVPVADTPENRTKLCDALQGNITALQGSAPVVMKQDGKTVALDAAQRKQQTDAAQAQQAKFCAKP